ncbi:MAG: zinc ribbon domain-containing protein [Peptococcaceae bacterium]|jgi:putative FmdB family regulatory protein|nr:zinc ribbon domain-containing protein [Peptococcaceae bacterium]
MPIYEFRCEKCGRRFERLCSLGESGENLRCPECGSPAPRRVMSGFAAGGSGSGSNASGASAGGCSGCAGGSCATCH